VTYAIYVPAVVDEISVMFELQSGITVRCTIWRARGSGSVELGGGNLEFEMFSQLTTENRCNKLTFVRQWFFTFLTFLALSTKAT
jgi:hypothetical protein